MFPFQSNRWKISKSQKPSPTPSHSMQQPKENKGYSTASRVFPETVHACEGYFCLFSHQTEACISHPS